MTNDKRRQIAALKELLNYDHCFVSEEGVKKFTAPFGFEGYCVVVRDSRDKPKGITLEGSARVAKGRDAADLAADICNRLGVKYPQMMGRGFKLRACVGAALAYLEEMK